MIDVKYSSDNIKNFVDKTILSAKEPLAISLKQLQKCFIYMLQVHILYHLDYVPSTKSINNLLQLVRYAGETTEEFEQVLQNIKPLLFDEAGKNRVKEKKMRLEGQMLQSLQAFFKIINLV